MTESPPALSIPWGIGERLILEIPPSWSAPEVVWPALEGTLDDYPGALSTALDAPEALPPIEKQVGPGSKVAIVVDDPSRWTPVREALPVLLARIDAAGVARDGVSVSVGVGRHHAVDERAMRA